MIGVEKIKVYRRLRIVLFLMTIVALVAPFTESLPWVSALILVVINLIWMTTVTFILIARNKAAKVIEEVTKDLQKFKQAVEGVSDAVTITDAEGILVYVNKAAEKMTGYRRANMIGGKSSLWENQMDDAFYKKFWKTLKEEKRPYWGEMTNKRKNGEIYDV